LAFSQIALKQKRKKGNFFVLCFFSLVDEGKKTCPTFYSLNSGKKNLQSFFGLII